MDEEKDLVGPPGFVCACERPAACGARRCRGYAGPLSAAIHLPLLVQAGDSIVATVAAGQGEGQFEEDPYAEEYEGLPGDEADSQQERVRKDRQELAGDRGGAAAATHDMSSSDAMAKDDRNGSRSSAARKSGGSEANRGISLPDFRARLSAVNRKLLDSTRSRLQVRLSGRA